MTYKVISETFCFQFTFHSISKEVYLYYISKTFSISLEVFSQFSFMNDCLLLRLCYGSDVSVNLERGRPGRVRSGINLPQEHELVRLFENIDKSHHSWKASTWACRWTGVTCQYGKSVSSIHIEYWKLKWSLNFDWLPRTLQTIIFARNELNGTVPLDSLPHELVTLNLEENRFSGKLELAHLPQTLITHNRGRTSHSSPLPGSLSSSELSSLPGSLLLVLSSPGSYAPWWPPLRTTGRATAGGHVVCVYRGCELAPLSPYML